MDGCLDFGLIWFGFSTFAGLGVVVLFAAFVKCDSECRALDSSGCPIVSFVGWSCAVSTCVGTRSVVFFRVRLDARVPSFLSKGRFQGAYFGFLAKLPTIMGIAEVNQILYVFSVIE